MECSSHTKIHDLCCNPATCKTGQKLRYSHNPLCAIPQDLSTIGNTHVTIAEMIEVREYVDANGRNHYRRWIAKLDANVAARVINAVLRIGEGNFSNVKPEGEGVSALRLNFGPGYRIYFGQDGKEIVILLAGGTKHLQQNDIQLARQLWHQYRQHKKEK